MPSVQTNKVKARGEPVKAGFSWRNGRRIRRLGEIARVSVKYGFGYILEKYDLKSYLPRKERKQKFPKSLAESFAKRFVAMIQELGPTFIKVGQLLSVRPDLVPPELVFQLEDLQDSTEPFDSEIAKEVVEDELGKEISEVFEYFDSDPIASASIGQVHKARLKSGQEVVVKIQRPGAERMIDSDLDLLFLLAKKVRKKITFVDIVAVAQEFSDSLHRELDYRVEGRHVDKFRLNFKDDSLVKIPLVYWKYTSRRVMTLEYIEGTKLTDLATPESKGIDTYKLAEHGAQAFMKQVLEDGFFHGDLHPANMFITPDGRIAYLDFGIVGQVSEKDRETMVFMLLAIIKKDVAEIVSRAKELGVIIPEDTIPEMKEEFNEVLDRYYGRKLEEIKIDIIGKEFLGLIYRHHLRIPNDFALLAKALVTIEGTAKGLYPEVNMLDIARPYVLDLIKREYSPAKALEDIYEVIKGYIGYMLDFPREAHEVLEKAKKGELEIKYRYTGLDQPATKFEKAANRLAVSLTFAAVLFGASLIFIFKPGFWLSVLWFGIAVLFGLWIMYSMIKS